MHQVGDREKGQFTYCNVSTCVKFELVYSSDFTKYENSALRKRAMFFLGTIFLILVMTLHFSIGYSPDCGR